MSLLVYSLICNFEGDVPMLSFAPLAPPRTQEFLFLGHSVSRYKHVWGMYTFGVAMCVCVLGWLREFPGSRRLAQDSQSQLKKPCAPVWVHFPHPSVPIVTTSPSCLLRHPTKHPDYAKMFARRKVRHPHRKHPRPSLYASVAD